MIAWMRLRIAGLNSVWPEIYDFGFVLVLVVVLGFENRGKFEDEDENDDEDEAAAAKGTSSPPSASLKIGDQSAECS